MGTMHRDRLADALRNEDVFQIIHDQDFAEANENLNPYAVAVAGSHVGFEKCRPFVTIVYAKNKKQAAYLGAETPRAKGDQKYSIFACERLGDNGKLMTKLQVWMINAINDRDPYMYSTRNGYDAEHKNMTTNLSAKFIIDDYYKHGKNPQAEARLGKIKTAEDFDEGDVIQRHCAPQIVHGMPVPTKRVNMNAMLQEWFTYSVKKYAMRPFKNKKKVKEILQIPEEERTEEQNWAIKNLEQDKHSRANLLMIYYKLFGPNNPLGIQAKKELITGENGEGKIVTIISYPGDNDHRISFIAPEKLVSSLEFERDDEPPVFETRRNVIDETPRTPEEVAEQGSQRIAKFRARLAKAQKEFGEE